MAQKTIPAQQGVAPPASPGRENGKPREKAADAFSIQKFLNTADSEMTLQNVDRIIADSAAPPVVAEVIAPVTVADAQPLALALAETRGEPAPSFGNLSDPALYLNRELSWLKFNQRVLHEASDARTPLLERVKFLAIASSNLDEFYMKRIGGLKQQIAAGVTTLSIDGRMPRQQFLECVEEIATMQSTKTRIYSEVMSELTENDITVHKYSELTSAERDNLRNHYKENVLPLITPLAIDSAHPFPFISNLSLNLLVALRHPGRSVPLLARVKIPIGTGVKRFVKLAAEHQFVLIEDIMINNLDLLFPGLEVHSCDLFRVTRNANSDSDRSDADDLLELIESELTDRKFAPVVRLQTSEGISPALRTMLALELGLDEDEDVFETDIMVRMSDLMEIAGTDIPSLHDAPHYPFDNAVLDVDQSIFQSISNAGSILLQHPYESFVTSVERFVQEASRDPQVVAIKMTLYRTSAGTKIIEYLIDAARNGKQVAVVVELQARFDEAANIQWASRMEEAGIHVNYGVLGLKTHCKVILVVRREDSGLCRYAHFGTGNYHAGTARLYSDSGLLTCDANLTNDLSELFNYLTTGWIAARDYRRILTAPLSIKKELLAKIDREIALHSEQSPGLIRLKTNALEDTDITAALYRASQVGVKVELIVRDICRLRPGVPGLSENISVISVIGRFLEHSRIYYFRNGGNEEFYIGSADLMTRNLEWRVEVIAPVEDAAARRLLDDFLTCQLADRRNVWDMNPDGSYTHRRPADGSSSSGCQDATIKAAAKRVAQFSHAADTGMWKPQAKHHYGAALSRRERARGLA